MVLRLNTSSERYPGPDAISSSREIKENNVLTSPWWACKYNTVWSQFLELILEDLKTIAFKPSDLVLDAVDFCVVLCTFQDGSVFLNSIDALPFPGQCKCDCVSTCASKAIDQNATSSRRGLSNLCGNLTNYGQ